jgi:predicted Zn-dependent protease
VAARSGSVGEATSLVKEAITLAEQTDALNKRAGVLLALAEILRLAGEPAEAGAAVRRALALYEQKGNVAGTSLARRGAWASV